MENQSYEVDSREHALELIGTGEPDNIIRALLGLVSVDEDGEWLQELYLDHLNHEDFWVQNAAISCLGYTARVYSDFDVDRVKKALAEITDAELVGQVEVALDDIDHVFGNPQANADDDKAVELAAKGDVSGAEALSDIGRILFMMTHASANKTLWGLSKGDGWSYHLDHWGNNVFLVWPNEASAIKHCPARLKTQGARPTEISLRDFFEKISPQLIEDDRSVGFYIVNDTEFTPVPAETAYEQFMTVFEGTSSVDV